MSYFIFDMDETLAELYSVYYFVASFKLKKILEEDKNPLYDKISDDFIKSLDRSYDKFVKDVLENETSDRPLGILRPGILNVMEDLYELQKEGAIECIAIYSNNGNLESLEFIRDLIHLHLNTKDLIKECIHWNHPLRDSERHLHPGALNKTWPVLKNILIEGPCGADKNISPNDVHFFDDIDHLNLQDALGKNYHKVPAYTFKASFVRLEEIYIECINYTNIDTNKLKDYIVDIFRIPSSVLKHYTNANPLEVITDFFKISTEGTESIFAKPPLNDEGIEIMMDIIGSYNSKKKSLRKLNGGKRLRGDTVNGTRSKSKTSTKRRKHKRTKYTHTRKN